MTVRQNTQFTQPPGPTWLTLAILAAMSVATLAVTKSPQDVPLVLAPTLLALEHMQKGRP